ncbi:MAG: cob(I)yrinic acid a,c-diamide adenosyltransferase [Candidatus Omnitrophica bacterium]|nr:cob(I)yrinic acid a,c-diamide adenosyltransferase [Candidatus Omnitrophota bacterium]
MKIYTKKGDQGETGLIGGRRVSKHDLRIGCYGTVDELNSWIGLIASKLPVSLRRRKALSRVQDRLFVVGSLLAKDPEGSQMKLPELQNEDVIFLEQEIDAMSSKLPELKSFILPGGSSLASECHVARCVCRRAEREVVALSKKEPVDALVIVYLNRLSDYLFVLARAVNQAKKVKDVCWKAQL